MTAWMEHLHMQKPLKGEIFGVPVTLSAISPDGETLEINFVTTDSQGLYKTMWTPPEEGAFTIIANFTGSDSYWGAMAETAIGVISSSESTLLLGLPTGTWVISTTFLVVFVVFAIMAIKRIRKH
jgi:hypothetical protein